MAGSDSTRTKTADPFTEAMELLEKIPANDSRALL